MPQVVEAGETMMAGNEFTFRVEAAQTRLVADGGSVTTLLAFLSSQDGEGISGERIRFVVESGVATFIDPTVNIEQLDLEARKMLPGNITYETGNDIGNGVYLARLRSSETAGNVQVSAQWLTSPESPVPQVSTNIELVTAEQLIVRVDDNEILADGVDSAVIIAYVLDGLNRPVQGADVTFRILDGAGEIQELDFIPDLGGDVVVDGARGRYAALYRSPRTPGTATIEVSLPTITNPIRTMVTIEAVEASTLSGFAFPERVARLLPPPNTLTRENISTILVVLRDGEGELVPGMENALEADVISGPGEMQSNTPVEIKYADGTGSGVYQFAFKATEITGESIIEVTNREAPSVPRVQFTVRTVTETSPGIIDQADMRVFSEEPFFSDGGTLALLVAIAADEDGNIVNIPPDQQQFLLLSGRGTLVGCETNDPSVPSTSGRVCDNPPIDSGMTSGDELQSVVPGIGGTGIYLTNFRAGNANTDIITNVRAVFSTNAGDVVTQTTGINLNAVELPEIVIFPERIPAGQNARAIIDIFDVNDEPFDLGGLISRYDVQIEEGPGEILRTVNINGVPIDLSPKSNGVYPDYQRNDNHSGAIFEVQSTTPASQDIIFNIVDDLVAGNPTTESVLQIGDETQIRVVVSPDPADAGDVIEVVAFAEDEFGLPAKGHELLITVVSGSANLVMSGQMFDDGTTEVSPGISDVIANDGVYVGAIRTTGVAHGILTIRVTDLTPPTQPATEIQIPIAQ
ncbi:MAG: hypothetical protein D6737_05090 [Chloroflexi bacterium]|nr:MAG: hypothetical protein CUN54_01915 [Phototrophicales bacterium]RMF81364.1 MAG: hypothetical protein D6737_05090 [Chloroflexota bacterium]